MKAAKFAVATALLAGPVVFANPVAYFANLSGPNESPSNASPGTGSALVIIDTAAHTLFVDIFSFQNLTAGTTASHIHCCTAAPGTGTAGVATQTPSFLGFPLGVTSGSYVNTFDTTLASSYNPAFVTANGGTPAGAEAALAAGLAAGEAYLNIHTTAFPGGEIRGFLQPATGPIYEYDFFVPGTNTPGASFIFPGIVRDVSPASTPIPGFTGFVPPSPASLKPCNLTSNSSAELDCRAPTVHSGIFYFVFDYGAFPSKLGPFTGSGYMAPDGATPSIGTVPLLNGQIRQIFP